MAGEWLGKAARTACANAKPELMKNFWMSPGATVTSRTPGLSSEIVGTCPGSTPNIPPAPGMITMSTSFFCSAGQASERRAGCRQERSMQPLTEKMAACGARRLRVSLDGMAPDGAAFSSLISLTVAGTRVALRKGASNDLRIIVFIVPLLRKVNFQAVLFLTSFF